MNELAVADKGADWRRLKALVLDSVCPQSRSGFTIWARMSFSPGTPQEPRPGFAKSTVAAWRVRAGGPGPRGYLTSQLDAAYVGVANPWAGAFQAKRRM
jgi:hypothetical protein